MSLIESRFSTSLDLTQAITWAWRSRLSFSGELYPKDGYSFRPELVQHKGIFSSPTTIIQEPKLALQLGFKISVTDMKMILQ